MPSLFPEPLVPRRDQIDAPAPARQDANNAVTVQSASKTAGAAISNLLSGLGGTRDSGASARPHLGRQYLSLEELAVLLRGSIYRRICSILPAWSTKRGWTITDDTNEEAPLEQVMKDLGVRQTIRRADMLGRAFGESRIWLITDSPDDAEPLELDNVGQLYRLQVLDRREFTPIRYQDNAAEGELGEPVLYRVQPWRSGVVKSQVVHASRLLRFYGHDLPPSERSQRGTYDMVWGADAIGQTIWDGIRNLHQTGAAGARIAQELSVSVFKFASVKAQSSSDGASAYLSRAKIVNLMKSIANAVFLGPNDDYQRVQANPSGYKDLSEAARLELAMLSEVPMTLLFGMAPSGLSTDGESWQENWHGTVSDHQDQRYRTPLETLIQLLYHQELGTVPDTWSLDFNPLSELTEKEKAEIRLLITQADDVAIAGGVLAPEEARQRYVQAGGFAFDLQPVDEDVLEPEVDEGALAEAEALVAERLAQEREDAADGALWIGVSLPESQRPAWEQARSRVADVVELDAPDNTPHVTLLYLGQVDEDRVPEVLEAVRRVGQEPVSLQAERPRVFAPGEHSKGAWPVVLGVDSWQLQDLHHALLPRLAHLISAKQFPRYQPHLTLGYAPELSLAEQDEILTLEIDEIEWTTASLEVRHGSELVATVPLTRRDAVRGDNPYAVHKQGSTYVVVKTSTGKVVSEHDTEAEATAHFRALEANVSDEE